jgi:zinc D-Ala-D-Ala carboxypeptidase
MNLSEHFTDEEFSYSKTASRAGINNSIPSDLRPSAVSLCENVLEKVRLYFGRPVHIDSGYRSIALNAIVPGSSNTSQHTKCEAADITIEGVPLMDIFRYIQDNLDFDQLILEYNSWVHVSYKNRKQTLRKDTGTDYIPFKA